MRDTVTDQPAATWDDAILISVEAKYADGRVGPDGTPVAPDVQLWEVMAAANSDLLMNLARDYENQRLAIERLKNVAASAMTHLEVILKLVTDYGIGGTFAHDAKDVEAARAFLASWAPPAAPSENGEG